MRERTTLFRRLQGGDSVRDGKEGRVAAIATPKIYAE